ncbi:MAG: Hsp33 family molecular chaperone HslO [Halioglobus sp.]
MDAPQDESTQAQDRSLRFLFEDTDIRGELVHLDKSFQDILDIHQYAPAVGKLIGEFLAAAVLLSTTLKFEGKLILQASSEGQIPLLMVECTNDRRVRAIARGAGQATSTDFGQLLHNGQLAITVDPVKGQRYQGIVPLVNDSLAHSLDAYFEQSEQLRTRLWLSADENAAAGMLLQQLPVQETPDPAERQDQWEHACALASTVSSQELTDLSAEQMLHRLYHQDPMRVFSPESIEFSCNCSRERTYNALATIGEAEINDILVEQGSITMDCEFCNQQYSFSPEDLKELIETDEPRTLH